MTTMEQNMAFFEQLYKSLDETDLDTNNDVCLITGLPLTEHFVQLDCGHKFNYIPLYKEVINQKIKINSLLESTKLNKNEILTTNSL